MYSACERLQPVLTLYRYQGLYHDAMMLPTHFSFPDLFLTMTCNPRWPEIVDNIPPGADGSLYVDVVARVFFAKWRALQADIVGAQVFGPVVAFCWRVEWQFRGWPHIHSMWILANKVQSELQIDGVVSAEIPDPVLHPELHKMVVDFMMHGPHCGDTEPRPRCRIKNAEQCRFHFPKQRQAATTISVGQFPSYRRRCLISVHLRGHTVSDEWVVSYNAWLLMRCLLLMSELEMLIVFQVSMPHQC
jgi:hypothetical protein